MITVSHLKKTYIGKHNTHSRGLVDVSFTLPEKGFVFVLGKSGSGKSTLLNLLGGLDTLTDGKIYLGKKDFSSFTEKEKREYKASFCGFIFQDYKLIDELTVKENIALSLELISDEEEKEKRIDEILKEVDLVGYENRYPKELSGGQKQRVAIARALIKKPKFVLCDEPTGNLDQKTSKQILDLLKRISKDCLVFMVSHDEKAAFEYADKKITLEEGLVIKEEIRDPFYENKLKIEDGICYLPFNRNLTEEETKTLSEQTKNGSIKKLVQNTDGFYEFKKEKEEYNYLVKPTKFSKDAKLSLIEKYSRKDLVKSNVYGIIFSLLTILLILIQTFLSFEQKDAIISFIDPEKQSGIILSKVNLEENNGYGVYLHFNEEEEENLFSNYAGEKYPIYNLSFPLTKSEYIYTTEYGMHFDREGLLGKEEILPKRIQGVIATNEDYLRRRFGNENNELVVLSGDLEACKSDPKKLVFTDFIADSILMKAHVLPEVKNYHYVFEKTFNYFPVYDYEVGAIIKTDYKEKYPMIPSLLTQYITENTLEEHRKEIISLPEYEGLKKAYYNGELTLIFSIYPEFTSADVYATNYCRGEYLYYSKNVEEESFFNSDGIPDTINFVFGDNQELNDDEIIITKLMVKVLAQLGFKEVIGETLHIIKREGNMENGKILLDLPLKIKAINSYACLSRTNIEKINKARSMVTGYYLPLTKEITKVLNKTNQDYYIIEDYSNATMTLLKKTMNMFTDTFRFLETLVIIILVSMLIFIGYKATKDFTYQIGVFKSLGMSNKDMSEIFLMKNTTFTFGALLLSSLLIYPFLRLANSLIMSAYNAFTKTTLPTIPIFVFKAPIFFFDFFAIILIFSLTTILPILMLKKISPAMIVNHKKD